MKPYRVLPRNRYYEVFGGLNLDTQSDQKVGMVAEVDVTRIDELRQALAQSRGLKPSYTAFVIAAVSSALRQHPYANRIAVQWPFYSRMVQLADVDLSVAVERDTPGMEQGVFAATLRGTDRQDVVSLTESLQELSGGTGANEDRWRTVQRLVGLLPPWLARFLMRLPFRLPGLWVTHRGGPVIVSSPAKYGVDLMVGHWPWPIGFSFGLVRERPFVVEGQVQARRTMFVTMSFDRRIMSGAPAARFFHAVTHQLSDPDQLF